MKNVKSMLVVPMMGVSLLALTGCSLITRTPDQDPLNNLWSTGSVESQVVETPTENSETTTSVVKEEQTSNVVESNSGVTTEVAQESATDPVVENEPTPEDVQPVESEDGNKDVSENTKTEQVDVPETSQEMTWDVNDEVVDQPTLEPENGTWTENTETIPEPTNGTGDNNTTTSTGANVE